MAMLTCVVPIFIDVTADGIPRSFGNLTNLTQLDLQCNALSGDTVKVRRHYHLTIANMPLIGIPGSLGNLMKLEELYLNSNCLAGVRFEWPNIFSFLILLHLHDH